MSNVKENKTDPDKRKETIEEKAIVVTQKSYGDFLCAYKSFSETTLKVVQQAAAILESEIALAERTYKLPTYTKFMLCVGGTALDGVTYHGDSVSISTWGTVIAKSNSVWDLTISDTNPFTGGHFGGTFHGTDSNGLLISLDFFSGGKGKVMPTAKLIWIDVNDGTNHLVLIGTMCEGINSSYPITVFSFSFTTPKRKYYLINATGTITLS
jgi:hypothetical protein